VSRHVVIGTAGHVDHGKTALVRALTGVETDRWEEERRRGITIDLGFAPLDLGDGRSGSVVDVPGHEDFIRNMVAGATGIDLALLVVAADESVMPQTVEHVAILDALGVTTGVVAIAKADLVEPAWLELVVGEVRERLASSAVDWRAVLPVSSVTGAGVAELAAALRAAADGLPERDAGDLFRMPVDRAFSVAGAGTVVTGTTWSGVVRTGDAVTVLPGEHQARVRGVQVHGVIRTHAQPGCRTALALAGLERHAVPRGTTIVAGDGWRTTDRLDAMLTLVPTAPPLMPRSRVRVHLGTAEVLARLTLAEPAIGPGETGMVRLRLERPLVARWGDRGVVRSYSPVTTIGGLVVADPWPAVRPRRPHGLADLMGIPSDRVAGAVRRAGDVGLPVGDLAIRLGLHPGDVASITDAMADRGIRRVGDRLVVARVVDETGDQLLRQLDDLHANDPLAPGLTLEAARGAGVDPLVVDAAIGDLVGRGTLVVEGATVRRATHQPARDAAAHPSVQAVGNAIREAGFEGRTAAELGAVVPLTEASRALEYLVRGGALVRVGRERFYDSAVLDSMVRLTADVLADHGELVPAQLRDRLGLTRKYLIPYLEWLDQQGYTVRRGDLRVAGPRLTKRSTAP
jgi:selenocysteine-specific elongation factor